MDTRIIFGYVLLFTIIAQITAMGAPTIFEGVVENPEDMVCQPTSFGTAIRCFFQNFSIIFRLMEVSTSYAILSTILLTPFIVILVLVILKLIPFIS